MPGTLLANGPTEVGPGGVTTMDREDAHRSVTNGLVVADGGDRSSLHGVNGDVGARAGPSGAKTSLDVVSKGEAMTEQLGPPPDIEHITAGYQPLSKLISRLVQDTFNELGSVIEQLADMAPHPNSTSHPKSNNLYSNHANSNAQSSSTNNSPSNIQKKARLMRFVQDRRAQFIKVLVITQWSRQSEDVSKAIDLKIWLDRQRALYDEAWIWMGDLKRSLGPARMPNPDIKTALEVMTTGRASWMPDLGYIPPKPLTPQDMLKTLRDINVLLTLRLNLHEALPAHFRDFSIADGRATFSVAGEFAVDLSIADEDPASQLYFIDFRFLFSPVPADLPAGRLRDEIEVKVNDVLRSDGLRGCYDFLHTLVLTYKINTLRRQATEMSRNRWTETVRVEMLRRTLVLQYWINKPGPKSWLEIGVSSGAGTGTGTSHLSARWFRDGKEVKDAEIPMQLANLSMESVLKATMSLHVNGIMTAIHAKLLECPLYARQTLSLSLSTSTDEPVDSSVSLQLTPCRSTKLIIEPTTGRFALIPPSALSLRAEQELNSPRDASPVDAQRPLSSLRCLSAMDEIERRASFVGWRQLKSLTPRQEDVKRIFPRDTYRISYFRRPAWTDDWVVAASVSMAGDDWRIVELLPAADVGYNLGDHQRIPVSSSTGKAVDPSYEFLTRLEHIAAGMITLYVNARELSKSNVLHSLRQPPLTTTDAGAVQMPVMTIHFSSLMSQGHDWRPWARDTLKVTYQGVSSKTMPTGQGGTAARIPSGQGMLVIEARLLVPLPQTPNSGSHANDDDISFHPASGAFAFRVGGPIGRTLIPQLKERLLRIERLIRFLTVVRRFNLACTTISLGRVVFLYGGGGGSGSGDGDDSNSSGTSPPSQQQQQQQHQLTADISFGSQSPMSLSLAAGNPHIRILDSLSSQLNKAPHGFEHVALLLGITLPLLRSFDVIEKAHPHHAPVYILPRSADWFHLRYTNPACAFDIRLRQRRDHVKWFVQQLPLGRSAAAAAGASSSNDAAAAATSTAKPAVTDLPSSLAAALTQLMDQAGKGWRGLRTGIGADLDGIAEVIYKLDEVVMRFTDATAASSR
ncbi:MAG: hypothetical protein M1825_001720 [Sarcosagium campestre]|nr:MAG: hypothetical protein M1825_001720 [Sarcosagium campestre]